MQAPTEPAAPRHPRNDSHDGVRSRCKPGPGLDRSTLRANAARRHSNWTQTQRRCFPPKAALVAPPESPTRRGAPGGRVARGTISAAGEFGSRTCADLRSPNPLHGTEANRRTCLHRARRHNVVKMVSPDETDGKYVRDLFYVA